uniref:Aminopeptidase O (putative) n=1 Tax=Gadus morhua TaxID=8049 RepID=A0A8C5BTU5_GADMO
MEPDGDQDTDDLPLRANANQIRVRHYVLDLTVQLHNKVIAGSIALFLEPVVEATDGAGVGLRQTDMARSPCEGYMDSSEALVSGESTVNESASMSNCGTRAGPIPETSPLSVGTSLESTSDDGDFTLVLDCCDLDILQVEELDVTSVPSMSNLLEEVRDRHPRDRSAAMLQRLVSMPSAHWRRQHQLFSECSGAPGNPEAGPVEFHTDRWSLRVKKRGITSPVNFPRGLRVSYETRPAGRSIRWTQDQDKRVCVYTAGSPINNRALFPCQEPPVAMSTWQARVRAPGECVVLMSGENVALPIKDGETGLLIWDYYVTMPMPASTFTLAVGCWRRAIAEPHTASWSAGEAPVSEYSGVPANTDAEPRAGSQTGPMSRPGSSTSGVPTGRSSSPSETGPESGRHTGTCHSAAVDGGVSCSHSDYPCRFNERSAWTQRVVPHRVFAPACLLQKARLGVLALLPQCLAAAHAVLGVHPFPRLDVLIVPEGFSSLGMASPHIIFLSQSVLDVAGADPAGGVADRSVLGSRLCHELAHSWFGLAIGARDWTEEWISEGFATYLEDVIWAKAQELLPVEMEEQAQLKALLRWRRLSDELQHSQEELQILRPNMEKTGEVSDCGASLVKHALNPDKTFMQVHYLKGYFLLTFLASEVGECQLIHFFRQFVMKYHGQLILSQDFLQMLLDTFPDMLKRGLTLTAIYADWMDRPGIPKVVKWTLPDQGRKGRGRKRRRGEPKVNYRELTSDRLVLLLELLLEEEVLSSSTLRSLNTTYHLHTQDAEVRHRWCELVVKHGHSQAYQDVQHFLVHDQAMGVYLYGELMVQEKADQQALARRCLSLVQEEMDQSARRVVEEMIL